MLSLYIRYFFIILCAIYLYHKILIKYFSAAKTFVSSTILALIITSAVYLFSVPNVFSRIFFMYTLSIILVHIRYRHTPYVALFTTLISYGISFILYLITSFIAIVILISIYRNANSIPYEYADITVAILQTIFTMLLIKNTQLSNGISLLIRKTNLYIGCFASFFLILFISLINATKDNISRSARQLVGITALMLSLLILYYWRHRIKQTYIENMRRLEILNYENSIADKDKHIRELENQNAHLGKIIHKYRKVIPAMELSVMELFQNSEGLSVEELKDKAKSLQTQLEELHAERNNLLDQYQKETVTTSMTGLHTIDAMLALMEKRAKQEWIRFKTQIAPDIKELASHSIKEADLLHMLGDLIENAFHAVNAGDNKEIMIHLGKLNDCLLFEVSDSGSAFDIQTYQHIGNEPFTSRKEDGGTGTGLMDIWSIKKKYKASLYIYEYEPETNIYTKKISFLFDGKNHFLLKTYRDKEIRNTLIRGDLHVFSHQTD